MTTTNKKQNTPLLRFPEFTGEWKKKKLGEVADNNIKWSLTGGPFGSDLKSNDYTDIGVRVIQLQNMGDGEFIDDSKIFTSYEKANNLLSCNIYPNEIIISKMGDPVARACIIPKIHERYLMCSDGIRLVVDKNSFNNYFVFLYINYDNFRNEALTKSTGSTRKRIGLSELREIKLSFPSLPEQTKIASFLTAVDEKIQALKQKKNGLEQYKKGVMQRIFNYECDNDELRIRFKDENGKDFPKWEMKKLGELGETYGGLSGKTKENFGIGKPYIQYKQIFDDSKINISKFELVDIEENETQNRVQFGDVFFTISSETPNEIGMSSVLLDEIDELYLNSFCFGFRANSLSELTPYFSRYLFRSENFRNEIVKLAQGSTRYNMSKLQLLKIEIHLPSLPEQEKIANFLSAIDEKINHTQTQIEKTERWKKGLLQQMFV